MQTYTLEVLAGDSGKRLDVFLMEFFNKEKSGLSRTFIQKIIAGRNVTSGETMLLKPHLKVKENQEIKVKLEEKTTETISAEDIDIDVVYEDDDIAIINKPQGMVVHPAPGNYEHTLVNALLHRFKKLSDVNQQRPGIVHRLDKDTSGLLVIAKNNFAHLSLAKQFAAHSIKRTYVALVKGKMEFNENIIELPIGRHPYKRKNMAVGIAKHSKYAKTYYRTLKRTAEYSVLELEPFTGRTHQLRVHLAYIGHPILGDSKYGRNNNFKRMALHAKSIGFLHPRTEKCLEFSCEMPEEFKELIEKYPDTLKR